MLSRQVLHPGCGTPVTALCHPGRQFSAGGRRRLWICTGGDVVAIAVIPPPHLSLPFPCISCLAVCVCGYLGTWGLPAPTHAALDTRACCVRRSGCEQGGLRVVLAAVSAYKHREKCCPDCAGRCAREAKQPALLLMYTVSHASPFHRRHTCLTPTRLLHHLCMVTPVVSGTKNASSCNSCTHIANARGCTSPPP